MACKVFWLADSCSIDFEQSHAICSTEESIRKNTIAQTAPLNAVLTITTKNTILQDKYTLFDIVGTADCFGGRRPKVFRPCRLLLNPPDGLGWNAPASYNTVFKALEDFKLVRSDDVAKLKPAPRGKSEAKDV